MLKRNNRVNWGHGSIPNPLSYPLHDQDYEYWSQLEDVGKRSNYMNYLWWTYSNKVVAWLIQEVEGVNWETIKFEDEQLPGHASLRNSFHWFSTDRIMNE